MVRRPVSLIGLLIKLLVAWAIAAAGLIAVLSGGGRVRWFAAWRDLAVRYRGHLQARWWLPQMVFAWRDQPTRLACVRRMDGWPTPGTLLESRLPENRASFIVQMAGWGGVSAPETGAAGDSAFARSFPIQLGTGKNGDPGPLNEATRWQLVELAQWSGRAPLRLEVNGTRFRLWRSGHLRTAAELDDFLRLALRVIDQMRAAHAEGLQFVNEQQATLLDDVVCPVCSNRPEGAIVVCVRCKTPHCRECWDYNGRCGMFACGETRPVRMGR